MQILKIRPSSNHWYMFINRNSKICWNWGQGSRWGGPIE